MCVYTLFLQVFQLFLCWIYFVFFIYISSWSPFNPSLTPSMSPILFSRYSPIRPLLCIQHIYCPLYWHQLGLHFPAGFVFLSASYLTSVSNVLSYCLIICFFFSNFIEGLFYFGNIFSDFVLMSDHYLPFVFPVHFIFECVSSLVSPGTVPFWLVLIFEWGELLLDQSFAESILGSELGPYSG